MVSRLKLIRKELGLTQELLAQKLGVGKSALSMIETGTHLAFARGGASFVLCSLLRVAHCSNAFCTPPQPCRPSRTT